MKIAPARADRFCAAPDAGIRLVLIYGPNEGLVRARAEACVRAVAGAADDPFRVATLDALALRDEPGRLADEAAALSFTGGRRVVRLRGVTDSLLPAFRTCLALPDAADSLVVAEAGPLTPRSRLRLLCEREKSLAALPCYDESADSAARLIETLCARRGLAVEPETVGWLAERLGSDSRQIENEIEKLSVYLGGAGRKGAGADAGALTMEVARACVGDAAVAAVDSIARLAAAGDLERLDRALARAFYGGVQPVTVLRAVARRLMRLHLATAALERGDGPAQAMGALRPPVYPRERPSFADEMARWSSVRAARALRRLTAAERDCKIAGGAPEGICRQALFAIARAARP